MKAAVEYVCTEEADDDIGLADDKMPVARVLGDATGKPVVIIIVDNVVVCTVKGTDVILPCDGDGLDGVLVPRDVGPWV